MRISASAYLSVIVIAMLSLLPYGATLAQDEFDDEFAEESASPSTAERSSAADSDPFDDDDLMDSDLADASGDMGVEDEVFEDDEEDSEEVPQDERDRALRMMSTIGGSTGGLRVVDARGGATDAFRLQLATEFFLASDFLQEGDEVNHIGGTLSFSWTPVEHFETYASISSYANSSNQSDPELFQVLGDMTLGAKGYYGVTPWLTVGGDLTLAILNTVGDIGVALKSTSFGLRGNLTADLRDLDDAEVPLMIRFGLQYFFDNSSGLIEDVESQRFAGLEDPADVMREESRHLITTEERFALNINRTDFLNLGLGFEAPLRVSDNFYINPLLEWTWRIPINRQGYSCLFIPDMDDPDAPMGGGDGCLDKEGASAFPMNLTLGVRVQPPVDGLSVYAAADIGITGTSTLTRELASNAPYNVMFGAAYAYDLVTPPVPEPIIREVERTVEVPALAPLRGRVRGMVRDAATGQPVNGAIVAFPGRELTSLVTDASGRFVTYRLEPGVVDFGLSHQEYNAGACRAEVPSDRPESGELIVDVRCDMQPMPRAGAISGTLVGDDGSNVNGANIRLTGALNRSTTSDAAGRFSLERLPVGTYQVRVEADGYLVKMAEVRVAARETAESRIILVAQPRRPSVVIRGRNLQIRRRINFVTNSAEIAEASFGLLAEIADVLIRNPNLRRVEIQGHTDDRGGVARNQTLSQSRADAVRNWLSSHGVEASRLEARGYGQARPLVPNITAGNRARNRRVQFVITDQTQ